MTARGSFRGMFWACLMAVALHVLLFAVTFPQGRGILAGVRVAPRTHYLARTDGALAIGGIDLRTIESPVVFSLPSGVGFSRVAMENEVTTPLGGLTRPRQAESFLDVDSPVRDDGGSLVPRELILTDSRPASPSLPSSVFQPAGARPAARRVTLVPALKERLVGGVVLPQALNHEPEKAWEARATLTVSEEGEVDHVFLDKPLATSELNQQVLNLLYGLRFKPGEPIEGGIEIYSPEATVKPEGAK
ncbi:hypothetical protein [Pontiella sp.]|uniref:hypothetical protein n=1 Tax=Pontiella sp. TaxID=2837462 RepID=UPI003568891C